MCESQNQVYDCWQCPQLVECDSFEAKKRLLHVIPFEVRYLGFRLDKLLVAKKIEKYIERINYLSFLRKIERRLDHLLQLQDIDKRLDCLLSVKDIQSNRNIKGIIGKFKCVLRLK